MYHDESNRSGHSPLTRRSIPKYSENKSRPYQQNQSPSTTYGSGYNNQQHNGVIRRRPDNGGGALTANNRGRHFNPLDRVVKQNDIIIRLLNEIRDRLPAPPQSEQSTHNNAAAVHPANESFDNAAHDESMFEASDDQETVSEEAAEVSFEALEQQEEDNFNI